MFAFALGDAVGKHARLHHFKVAWECMGKTAPFGCRFDRGYTTTTRHLVTFFTCSSVDIWVFNFCPCSLPLPLRISFSHPLLIIKWVCIHDWSQLRFTLLVWILEWTGGVDCRWRLFRVISNWVMARWMRHVFCILLYVFWRTVIPTKMCGIVVGHFTISVAQWLTVTKIVCNNSSWSIEKDQTKLATFTPGMECMDQNGLCRRQTKEKSEKFIGEIIDDEIWAFFSWLFVVRLVLVTPVLCRIETRKRRTCEW